MQCSIRKKGRIPARVRGCACFVRLLFRGPATAKGLVELLGFELLLEALADEHGEQPGEHRRAQQQAGQPARHGEPAAPQADGEDRQRAEPRPRDGAPVSARRSAPA